MQLFVVCISENPVRKPAVIRPLDQISSIGHNALVVGGQKGAVVVIRARLACQDHRSTLAYEHSGCINSEMASIKEKPLALAVSRCVGTDVVCQYRQQ